MSSHLSLIPLTADSSSDQLPRATALSDLEATVVALQQRLALNAVERDAQGGSPLEQRNDLRLSGLLGLSISRELGGLGGSWRQCLDTVRSLAQVDGSVAHLFAFHHLMLATVTLYGEPSQWSPWLARTAQHDWFWGNALNPRDGRARFDDAPHGWWLSGPKSFCSGATDSQMLVVSGQLHGKLMVAAIPTARSGIQIQQDWHNIGQRQTDSGSVQFDRVRVDQNEALVTPGPLSTPRASLRSLISQLILVHIYVGIAEGAYLAARDYVCQEGRPWDAATLQQLCEDPYVVAHFGDFWAELEASRLLAARAADGLDACWQQGHELTAQERGRLAVDIATAKVVSTRHGLDICNRLFEVTGARSTHAGLGLDRFWRNLRTHTLHDPIDHKRHELGAWALTEALPIPGFYS